jgi:hypothetical protein
MVKEAMPMIDLTVPHGRTLEEARQRLETAAHQVSVQFGAVIRRVEWAPDRNRVKLEGVGIRVEIWVDAREVHATGDIPILGALLGARLGVETGRYPRHTSRARRVLVILGMEGGGQTATGIT